MSVRRTGGRVVGYYPSHKNNRPIGWESQMEQKACALFEFSSAIASYQEQPEKLRIPHDQGGFNYTPDFLLTLHNGNQIIVEVKPKSKFEAGELKERLRAIAAYLSRRNKGFIVLTETELNRTEIQENLALLRPYIRHTLSPHEIDKGRSVAGEKNSSLGTLFERLGRLSSFALIAQGHIEAPLQERLESTTTIALPKEEGHAKLLFSYRTAPDFQ